MICTRCLLFPCSSPLSSTLPQHLAQKTTRRLASSTTTTTTIANPATSTSAAQPFSTPLTPSPSSPKSPDSSPSATPSPSPPTSAQSQKTQPPPRSTMKAGTPLKGLNFVKGKEMPLAREDGEYPDWLWGLLEGGKFAKSAKQRKLAARAARRSGTTPSEDLAPELPLHEQSIDLPAVEGGWRGIPQSWVDGKTAREGREVLTKSLRTQRRKGIKEGNFLRGMR
ncbi:MAG: hypothetical protein L6R37_005330 [Teloschistes peruensis]|nr:MAG: hypothetical protein L6R37_005330 [Teloschistes peruensis]